MPLRDPYEILGLARGATLAQVKRAFRQRARQTHPDGRGDGASEAAFDEARSAYIRLLDELAMAAATTGSDASSLDLVTRLHFTPRELVLGTERRLAYPLHPRSDGATLPAGGRTLEFNFPPMTAVGARLRWAGHGWQRGRARGALVVEVASSEMPAGAVKGDDLRISQPISMVEWLGGGDISVSAPEGRVLVTLEPRHPTTTKLRLSGRGLPRREGGRGDLIVTLQPRWPQPADAAWPRLLEAHRTSHSGLLDLFSTRAESGEL